MKRSRVVLLFLLCAPACTVAGGSGGVGAVSCGIGPGTPGQPQIELVVPPGQKSPAIQVRGLNGSDADALRANPPSTDDWQALLKVTVVADKDDDRAAESGRPAVAGSYAVRGDAIVFTPMFGFDLGQRYRADFDRARLPSMRAAAAQPGDLVDSVEVSLPKPEVQPTTVVDRVYPTSDAVPENQLRLYVHFSAPMGLRGGLDHIKLLDAAGVEVKDPFLPLDAEFWNADRTRFTVFFDPGRVKRGILPNKELGRSLTEGHPYTLVVSREWRDGQGLPLKEDFKRTFRVGPPDEKPLDQHTWRLQPPRAGSRDALAVGFPEPLDRGLLQRALGVVSGSGQPIEGETAIDPGETRWTFMPRNAWKAGEYRLRVLSILEDLAGNRIGRAFEVDQFERADRQAEPEEVFISFAVR